MRFLKQNTTLLYDSEQVSNAARDRFEVPEGYNLFVEKRSSEIRKLYFGWNQKLPSIWDDFMTKIGTEKLDNTSGKWSSGV